jgi:hypothetical protein
MDESKFELPSWLPWATTACLAALVACLVELWSIERERNEVLGQEAMLAQDTIKASDNQLEAERIMNARQLQNVRTKASSDAGFRVVELRAPADHSAPFPISGFVVLDPRSRRGELRLWGRFGQAAGRDYQLWVEAPAPGPSATSCGVFHASAHEDSAAIPITVTAEIADGSRFLLVDCVEGGAGTLEYAKASGSIVLASLPFSGKISE